jgi:hypothetical protein
MPILPVPMMPAVRPCMLKPTSPPGEVGVTGALIRLMDAAVEGHHQAHRMFGNGLGE